MAQSGITGPIGLAIAKDHLFISFEPTLLEQILRGGYPALAESAEYQAVSKHFPSQASFLAFDRPDDGARAFYGMLGNEQFRAALDQMRTAPNAPSLGEVLDPKLLPEFSVIEKYLSPRGRIRRPGRRRRRLHAVHDQEGPLSRAPGPTRCRHAEPDLSGSGWTPSSRYRCFKPTQATRPADPIC